MFHKMMFLGFIIYPLLCATEPTGRWILAKANDNCTDGCAQQKLACVEDAQLTAATSLTTLAQYISIAGEYGLTIKEFNNEHTNNPDVPNIDTFGTCYITNEARTNESCDSRPTPWFVNKRRFCFCTPPTERWILAKANDNCTDGCAQQNLVCVEDAQLKAATSLTTHAQYISIAGEYGLTIKKFNNEYTNNPDVPNIDAFGTCYVTNEARTNGSCGSRPTPWFVNKRRFCFCTHPTTAAPTPNPTLPPTPNCVDDTFCEFLLEGSSTTHCNKQLADGQIVKDLCPKSCDNC